MLLRTSAPTTLSVKSWPMMSRSAAPMITSKVYGTLNTGTCPLTRACSAQPMNHTLTPARHFCKPKKNDAPQHPILQGRLKEARGLETG
eukprot:CAMPEP_0180758452 /NCGR_PEP_ID=MMETSP1038_2-20121128/35287_1 /TAXON_ID=632150 /ORGANISM="Azadinium spinosum, Strain 3D9" /LENGTH=88 /DNA_ID=CAMNT_0022792533 /DNA_START=284 /DNA_END=550 /DNA_ORIENTATION=-